MVLFVLYKKIKTLLKQLGEVFLMNKASKTKSSSSKKTKMRNSNTKNSECGK